MGGAVPMKDVFLVWLTVAMPGLAEVKSDYGALMKPVVLEGRSRTTKSSPETY